MEVEKIAANRYRLHAHDHVFTVDAQALLDLMEYGLRYARELEQEAKLEQTAKQAAQEYEDTRKYMEHHYLGGE